MPEPPTLLLGVDGGNTKTVALIAKDDGTIVGAGRAGRSDIHNTPDEAVALDQVQTAVDAALAEAGAAPDDLGVGAFSMAGADWPEDLDLLRRAMTRFGYGRQIVVVNDAIGALRAGTPDGVGVSVTCGTGIAVGARNAGDKVWYSGHWPVAFGGAELGQRALVAIYEAHLGLGPPTSLTDGILAFFEAASVEDVLHRSTTRGTDQTWAEQARLAPILLDEAAAGDAVAQAFVHEAGLRNADVAVVAARAVGLDQGHGPFRLVLGGGLMRHPSGLLKQTICRRFKEVFSRAEAIVDAPEPVVGAVLLAGDALCHLAPASMRDRLVATSPGAWLFAT